MKRILSGLMLMASSAASAQQPDIVLIQTGDQPYHTLAFMPLTDSLMASGTRFTRFYANMALGPSSKATALTGFFAHNHKIVTPTKAAAKLDTSKTIAVWLQAAGYRTALIGTYLEGYKESGLFPAVPQGWSYWAAFEIGRYWDFRLSVNGKIVRYDRSATNYSTDVLRDLAIRFIQGTPTATPLFLYFGPYATRTNWQAAPEDVGSFSGLGRWNSPNYNEADVSDKPLWVRLLNPAKDSAEEQKYERGAATLQSVDRAILTIVQAAEARARPLVVVFSPENGFALGAHRWTKKNCVYEECSRVIALIRGPGIAPGTVDALASNVDLTPTLLDYAHTTAGIALDGRSLRPLLERTASSWIDAILLECRKLGAHPVEERYWGVRTGRHLYAEYDNGDRELYDLDGDPWELDNRVGDPGYAALRDSLDGLLDSLK